MFSGNHLIAAGLLVALTVLVWLGLWRLYRWLYVLEDQLDEAERLILERQLVAMMLYFPVHLSAVILPIGDVARGIGSVLAAFLLAYIGISAVRNRLFVAFNRQSYEDAAAVRAGMAIAAGWVMISLSIVILGHGMYLLRR